MGRRFRPVQYRIGVAHADGQHLRFSLERYVRSVCVDKTVSECRMLAREIQNDVARRVFDAWMRQAEVASTKGGG